MRIPRLIFPVPVKLQKLDRDSFDVDNDYRGVYGGKKYLPPVSLKAQVQSNADRQVNLTKHGNINEFDGYLVFDFPQLNRAGVSIDIGDLVISIGNGARKRSQNFYIEKVEYKGHYPNIEGYGLVFAHYRDRGEGGKRQTID